MSASTFFGAFLDGFTGAGLARKLTIPNEPGIGFAPAREAKPEVVVADLRGSDTRTLLAEGEQVVELRFDSRSEKVGIIVELSSGEVKEIPIERESLSKLLLSAAHRHSN